MILYLFLLLGTSKVYGQLNDISNNEPTIRMASILFRHADRNPTELYPNDPHISHDWPGGLGALTKVGSLQAYTLGKNLKFRYNSLLPKNTLYTKNEMYVLSSAAERCLMTAQCVLAGLIPPDETINTLPINWQPVAINSLQRSNDMLLAQTKPCKKYTETLLNLYADPPPDLDKMNKENKNLYKILTKHTGQNISNILHVELLYNTLNVEKIAGLELPYWTENLYPEKMLPLVYRSYALFSETMYMKKVKGGPLLTEILKNMKSKRNNNLKPNRNIFLYSGHDVTLVNVMNSLNILNQTSPHPEYASAFGIELHYNSLLDPDYEVKMVYYKDSEEKVPKQITIPNCLAPCSLNQFEKNIEHLKIHNYDVLCENQK